MKKILLHAFFVSVLASGLSAQQIVSDLTIQRTLKMIGKLSPSQITSDQNNYAPTNFSTSAILRLSTDASRTITGLAGGTDGRYIVISNVGSNDIVLAAESSSSTAANRFALGTTLTLTANGGTTALVYDGTSSRWRPLVAKGGTSENPLTFSSPLTRSTNTISIPAASGSVNGYLSSTDWTLFNSKESALTFSAPLSRSTNTISLPAASSSVNGYLASSDWTIFNAKVSTGAITGSGLTMATARLLGRTTASSGAIEEITVGAGLSLSGGSLSATGGGGDALTANPLSQFAPTTSAQLASVISDETGSASGGFLVFNKSPTFQTDITTPKVIYTGNVIEVYGSGSPEGSVTAAVGSVYHRTDGSTSTTLYVKESGTGNTGWIAHGAGGGGSGSIISSGYTMTTDRLLGRTTASTGAIEEITVGTGLSLSGGNLSVSGSAGTKTLARWTALDSQQPTSNYAPILVRNGIAILQYNDSTAWSTVFVGVIPEGANFTTGIKVRIGWTAASATSGNVIWTAAFERGNTDLDSDSFATGVDSAASATNGTSGILTWTSIDLSGSEIDGLTAGDMFRLKVTRKAADASDTMTSDAEVMVVEIQQR